MSAFDEHENDEANGPKALREALDKANKELKAEREKNAALQSQVTQFSLDKIVSERNIPAKAVKYLKKDVTDPTADAVDAWLSENGADFGWKPGGQEASEGASAEEAPAQDQQVPQTALDPEVQAAYEVLQRAMNGSSGAPTQPLDALVTATEQIASQDLSLEDTIKALRAAGVPMA